MDKSKDTDIPKIFCHTEQIQIVDKGEVHALNVNPTRMEIKRDENDKVKALVVYYESAVAYEDPF